MNRNVKVRHIKRFLKVELSCIEDAVQNTMLKILICINIAFLGGNGQSSRLGFFFFWHFAWVDFC